MESEFQHRHHHLLDRHQNQQKQMSSGLTRYQSAPSSYFSTFFDRVSVEDFLNRPASPEIERNFEMCLSAGRGGDGGSGNVSASEAEPQKQTLSQIGSHASVSPNFHQRLPPNPRTAASTGVDRLPPMRTGGGNPNLIRHLSSPAGLFANLEIDIESFLTREMEHGTNSKANAEAAFRSSSKPPMSPRNVGDLSARFLTSSWDKTLMPENIRGAKRLKEEDRTLSGPSVHDDVQKGDQGNRPPLLAHHLSLPKTSSEMSDLEKLLLFQDSVPCKIRAKRGFATHPRSIAERVRRTKISERMRKLQDLVPNMDKQTSTSDMLDLAVEYIKDLQNQVKVLSDSQARCTCCYQQQQ